MGALIRSVTYTTVHKCDTRRHVGVPSLRSFPVSVQPCYHPVCSVALSLVEQAVTIVACEQWSVNVCS